MYNVFLDDSYIKSTTGEDIPLINAIGGIIIDEKNEEKLIQIMKSEKKKYTHENLPIKWNFRDSEIQNIFAEFERQSEHKELLKNSRDVRLNIIKSSLDLDYIIVISCIKSYSVKREIVKEKKAEFSEILFENLLFRVGNEAKGRNERYQIVMDWPTDSNPKPYNRAYYYMYNTQKTSTGNRNFCGPLSTHNLRPSVFYAKSTHSPCLQFADIIVGAIKDFIEMKLSNKNGSCIGSEAYELFKNKIRINMGKRVGYGIIVPSANSDFKDQMQSIFDE